MRVPSPNESKNRPNIVRASQIAWVAPQSGVGPNIAFDEWLVSFDPETSLRVSGSGDSIQANKDQLANGESTSAAELATDAADSGLITPTVSTQRQDPPPKHDDGPDNESDNDESERRVIVAKSGREESGLPADVATAAEDALDIGESVIQPEVATASDSSLEPNQVEDSADEAEDGFKELEEVAHGLTINTLSERLQTSSIQRDEQKSNESSEATDSIELAPTNGDDKDNQANLNVTKVEDQGRKMGAVAKPVEEKADPADDQAIPVEVADTTWAEEDVAVPETTTSTTSQTDSTERNQTPFAMLSGEDQRHGDTHQQNQSDSEQAQQPSQDQMLQQGASLQAGNLASQIKGTATPETSQGIKGIANASQVTNAAPTNAALVSGANDGRHAATSSNNPSHVGGDGKSTAARELPKGVEAKVMERVEAILRALGEAKDGSKLSFRLDPPDLGTITVDLSLAQGELRARLVAESPEVAQLLRERASELQAALRKAGIDADRVTVSTAGDGGALWDNSSSGNSNLSERGEQRGWQRSFSAQQGEMWVPTPSKTGSITEMRGSQARKDGWIA